MIGKLLKSYRHDSRIGMREMASALKLSPATYCRIENGKEVSQETMLMLINWLFKEPKK